MRSVEVLLMAVLFLSFGRTSKAQCIVDIPATVHIVNGIVIDSASLIDNYYVGAGDTLCLWGGNSVSIFVDSGGVLIDSSIMSGYFVVYAAAHSYVRLDSAYSDVYHDSLAYVDGNTMTSMYLCSPMEFFMLQQGSAMNYFTVLTSRDCSGPSFVNVVHNYTSGMYFISDYGDGTVLTTPVQAGNNGTGYVDMHHVYPNSGNYVVRHRLYSGSILVDSIQFLYRHKFCATMSVNFYNDLNNNCVYDSGVDYLPFMPMLVEVDSAGVLIDTISCTGGITYTAYGNLGCVYKFKAISVPDGLTPTCPVTGIIYDTLYNGIRPTKRLGLECASTSAFDYATYALIPVTGANDQWGRIYVTNTHCYGPNATISIKHSPKYKYTGGANPPPNSYADNTLTWNLSTISVNAPGPTKFYFVFWKNGNPLMAGDTVHNKLLVSPTFGDVAPLNNSKVIIDTVDASCDPNAIYVTPEGCTQPGTNLEYKITFENIGNMPAENIYIMDTLPPGLDPSSMKLKFASHHMLVEKIYNGSQAIFKFNFPNIMLPDSSDHEGCHGGLIYTINTRNTYPIGSSIDHKASIYFDYNLPVVTNTASTVMCWPTDVANTITNERNNILIYPNPATEQLTIKTEKEFNSYTITNSLGQNISKGSLKTKENNLDISTLTPGIYFIHLEGEKGTEVRSFVKM